MGRKARDVLLDAELQSWRDVSFSLNKILINSILLWNLTQQQTFAKTIYIERERETEKVILQCSSRPYVVFSVMGEVKHTFLCNTKHQYSLPMELVTHSYYMCVRCCTTRFPRGKATKRWKGWGRVGGHAHSSRTVHWHLNKLKSKQNCSCLYKQLDCMLTEDKGMKLCPYKVTLIFYLSNKKKHRRGSEAAEGKIPEC